MNFNLILFNKQYSKYYPNSSLPSKDFLHWFIGFVEGDGSFTISKRGDIQFVISQSTSDVKILYYIRVNLNIGQVIVQSKANRVHRFILQDFKSIHLICLLFNGNMVLPTRNAKFVLFLSKFNESLLKKNLFSPIIPIYDTLMPTLSDYWLSGFCDAEGCFTSSFNKDNGKFTIRWTISQKWEINKLILDHILNLFILSSNKSLIGYVKPHYSPNVWELTVNGVKNCLFLLNYFEEFKLKTKKYDSYCNWKILILKYINKDHLDLIKRNEIVELIKLLNKY